MKKLVIIHMRNGGCYITETSEDVSTLAKRLHGGHAVFRDELWSKCRELAINLADVSVIELIECDN